MSIRARLVIMCLVVALLPAVPLTYLVQSLLDKSFEVGLSPTVGDALESGIDVSRERFESMRADFRDDVLETIDRGAGEDALAPWLDRPDAGIIKTGATGGGRTDLPSALRPFAADARFYDVVGDAAIVGPRREETRDDLRFFETRGRTVQMAAWRRGEGDLLFYRRTDPGFLQDAERLITGRQIFAQLRLAREGLTRSFFYPFILVYAILVVFALALALFMAERLSDPLRRLVRGADAVAGGDWATRVDARGGGETGRLVGAFNAMVERLDDQRRRLVDAEKVASWRDVARHLAHEIKNPLMPIRLTVEEIRDQYKGDDTRYREMLDESTRVVGDEVEHLQQLVKSFSAFAKMPDLHVTRGSLAALAGDVARLYPQLDAHIEGSAPEVDFDADQMRRVLTNLFDNVVSVAGEGAAVRVTLSGDDHDAVVTIADNGPGIPAENLARVFEPWFTTRAGGTGLGLAISKQIVVMHGGAIDVESETGRGTTFTIRLPLPAVTERT